MKLVKFLMRLSNERDMIVELKNGTVAKGQITGVDIAMNTHMKNVIVSVKDQNPINLEHLTIRGSIIRYIIIPEHIALDPLLVDIEEKNKPPKNRNIKKPRK